MRLVIISDTHGSHEKLELPEGDVLIHCGDFSLGEGTPMATYDFGRWLESRDFKHKVCIAGNHDRWAAADFFNYPGVHYLQDSGVQIEGYKFWGMPWTPTFMRWFWMKNRGTSMAKVCAKIPEDTQVLVTHGPAFGELDTTVKGDHVGCDDLGMRMTWLDQLQVHCFGHIHESYGGQFTVMDREALGALVDYSGYEVVNASVLNEQYQLVNDPIVVDL